MKKIFFKCFKKAVKPFMGSGLGKIPLVMDIYSLFLRLLAPSVVEIGSKKMFIDFSDSLNLSVAESFSDFQRAVIQKNVKTGNVAVNIGAHIGYFTLELSSLVGEEGKVFAFEPLPDNFILLKANIETNGCKNVVAEQLAVSHQPGINFFTTNQNSLTNRIIKLSKINPGLDTIKVRTVCLDDYFSTFKGKIDFILIDVEGMEYFVIKGAKRIISRNSQIKIIMEFCPKQLINCGADPNDLLKEMNLMGFKLYDIDEKLGKLKFKKPREFITQYSKEGITNILCTRK